VIIVLALIGLCVLLAAVGMHGGSEPSTYQRPTAAGG
jgi:hypothetical protein